MDSPKTRNSVYCALILDEFVKELAAICQEHAVLIKLKKKKKKKS
jgi:hypothetical protein